MNNLLPMVIPQKKKKTFKLKEFINLYREPVITYQITPNNSPEISEREGRSSRRTPRYIDFEEDVYNNKQTSDLLLNTISGLFSKFYAPERVRLSKNGIKIKMNDVVSYKVLLVNGEMKFYLTVPKKWAKSFTGAIKKDWGQVDITEVSERIVDFNPSRTKAMEVHLRHHYALALKHDKTQNDSFYSSLASIASTMDKGERVLIDYNIEPVNNNWKEKATSKIKDFKNGKVPNREDSFTVNGLTGKVFDMFNVIFDEFINMIEGLMGAENKKDTKADPLFDLKYTDSKIHANSKGCKVQIRVLGEAPEDKKIKHVFKNIETSFTLLNGDNKFTVSHIKTKRGIKSIIKAVEEDRPQLVKTTDILFEKEMSNILKMPNKQTLKEYDKVISQDNFTRTEISADFFSDKHGAIPLGFTLEKESRKIYFGGYKRDWWTTKGRYVKDKTRLDDRSTATMLFGSMGSGKTTMSETQALYSFGAHLKDREEWKKESKSVVVFDVADGAMINNIYNHVPDWLKDRVVVLNHSNFKNPIAVNNADLQEYNEDIMQDDDYAYTLAEMEAKLVLEILKSDKTMAMDRWFTSALQAVHTIDKDYGYIEAMRALIDDDFRATEIIPHLSNRRLRLEMQTYHNMSIAGETANIIQTIENRFSQLERDQKLWDCIAQKPLRDEEGKVQSNFRKMMDGDEDGAYMILVYIPKSGVSQLYRKFLFAHYFTKIWSVALSREVGFAGREYRPETLVVIDEIHQIIDIPLIGRLFIDLFKEPRKYSLRLWLTLHGWSSLAKAGRGIEGDIKQSIMDNGCNLVMLKGGGEAFESLRDFLQPMTIADFNNLMNMKFCGIFAIRWKDKNHVFQAKLGLPLGMNPDFKKYSDVDSGFLTSYKSVFGRDKDEVRDENLDRSYQMIEQSIKSDFIEGDDNNCKTLEEIGIKEDGMKGKKSKK
ncbi:p-loop containing nucleoside triphosphate [Bacillus phage vB_BanS_Nate]|uniref:P-loop containing nucleoside triphosphate n=1 Tax=Bacillus phage vB_BanS_Nate TaxID=2894788 RepID=A0AAE8YUM4_9CAUD|nr:p-loop containing nucleoside triphosphate [Bacillus phage vB_BanS_Nate]UGO51103.1 p-loop containing nucleoside triphosphate [Bacillus phage vB_BanS_Nate]